MYLVHIACVDHVPLVVRYDMLARLTFFTMSTVSPFNIAGQCGLSSSASLRG